ncbi:MAG: zinc dependent phospholipase C family protein [Clostridia bacterium]|nr:zinc dependent phospholipase C family protein [Clostridia bacterium]
MPSTLTHYYVSEKVFESLDNRTKQLILPYKKLYTLGAQGPDILMGLMLEKDEEKKNYGELLHTKYVYAGLANAADYLASHQTDGAIYAYFLGCLTHYAADSIVHPYVYHYVAYRMKLKFDPILNNCLHTIVETEMDAFVGNFLLKGKNANCIKHVGGTRKFRNVVKKYYLQVNKELFRFRLTYRDVDKSFFFYRLLVFLCHRHNNGKLRYKLFVKLDNYLKAEHLLLAALRPRTLETRYDYLNLNKTPYKAVDTPLDCPTVDYSFPEMLDLSIAKGRKAIQMANEQIFHGVRMPKEFFDINYNGGYNEELTTQNAPADIMPPIEDSLDNKE